MRRIRRRKPKVVWLPVLGTIAGGEGSTDAAMGDYITMSGTGNGEIRWDASPVTFDYSESAYFNEFGTNQFAHTLKDLVEGNAYRLRRIVGKFHAGFYSDYQTEGPQIGQAVSCLEVAAGFMVCRTDESGNPTTDFDEVNPLTQESAEDPWIWRRKWILGNSADPTVALEGTQAVGAYFPYNTARYGSVADGPHIDQRTARIIGGQERLFFIVAARSQVFDANNAGFGIGWHLHGMLDIRILATLKSNQGNRRNASR